MKIVLHSPTGMKKTEIKAINSLSKLRDSWKGYGSFLVQDRQGSMEIDLLILSHSRIILVEVKEWAGEIFSDGKRWVQNIGNKTYYHNAPTHTKREHALRLQNLLKQELEHRWGMYYIVEYAIVLSGTAKIAQLAPQEKNVVFTLDEFLKINDREEYEQAFPFRPEYENLLKRNKRPNDPNQLEVFDKWLFGSNNKILPRQLVVSGYKFNLSKNTLFEHPKKLYKEVQGFHIDDVNDQALARHWDFSSLGILVQTTDQRANIALRESRLIRYLDRTDRNFKKDYLLEALSVISEEEITEEVIEIYNISSSFIKLDNYNYNCNSETDQYDLIRAILAPMAKLHELGICHRDLSIQKLWWDNSTKCVLFSSFSVAKFPENTNNQSVSDLRHLLTSNEVILPEDAYGELTSLTLEDSYKIDVFQLGIILYNILFKKYPKKNEEGIFIIDDIDQNHKFYNLLSKSLAIDPCDRYENASSFLDDFNTLTIEERDIQSEDALEVLQSLNPYLTDKIPFVIWPQHSNVDNDLESQRIRYETLIENQKYIVKIWSAIKIDGQEKYKGANRRFLEFAKRVEICKTNNLPAPQILDFGFGQFGLHLVYSYLEGLSLLDWIKEKKIEEKINICLSLIQAINILHDAGLWHGDLKPDNIIVDGHNQIKFIDFLDINYCGIQISNNIYLPKVFENNFSIDNYAIYLIIKEILFNENNLPDFYIKDLGENLDIAPNNLENLKYELNNRLTPKKVIPHYYINFPGKDGIVINDFFESDEGFYYCSFNKKGEDNTARIYLTGKNKKLSIFVTITENLTIDCISLKDIRPDEWLRDSQSAVNPRDKRSCIIEATITFSVENKPSNNDEFIQLLESIEVISSHLSTDTKLLEEIVNIEPQKYSDISLKDLWLNILETEKDILPTITITSKGKKIGNRKVIFDIEENINDFQISLDDSVALIGPESDSPKYYGDLVVSESGDGCLVIENERGTDTIRPNAKLRLSEQRSAISWNRRNKALQRVLDKESLIPNLISYFELKNFVEDYKPLNIPAPTPDLLDIYNLDSSKKDAFLKVLNNPINVIMGPPGTGKTTLLANLLDYVFRTNEIKTVLLVSQSHAAVNEVAVKYRDVAKRIRENHPEFKVDEPSMVRLGDINNIPESLHDIHVNYIQSQFRTKFFREFSNRLWIISMNIGLPKPLIQDCAKIFINAGFLVIDYEKLLVTNLELKSNIEKFGETPKLANLLQQNNEEINRTKNNLSNYLFNLDISEELIFGSNEILLNIFNQVAKRYSINNPQAIRKLFNLVKISYEWYTRLTADSDNFSGFLSKSRQLVIGTLVGIGKGSYNISDTNYDLIIIDEAARANASELSLAMQSGARILLVGDHKQLPPLYDLSVVQSVCKKLNITEDIVRKTDFERLYENVNGIMLDTQYRMSPPIGNLVSKVFYENKLATGREIAASWLSDLSQPWNKTVTWLDTTQKTSSENSYKKEAKGKSNELEAHITIKLIDDLFGQNIIDNLLEWYEGDAKVPPIGIITGYRNQKELIETGLQKKTWFNSYKHLIRIDTIDAYQGQESRLLILNLVRSNMQNKIGFLNSDSRINVALSRAKERLIIVGDISTWGHDVNKDTPVFRCLKEIQTRVLDEKNEYQVIHFKNIHEATEEVA
ncbi:TPA: AAA domain-containing protein [Acinetobacter baumannii]